MNAPKNYLSRKKAATLSQSANYQLPSNDGFLSGLMTINEFAAYLAKNKVKSVNIHAVGTWFAVPTIDFLTPVLNDNAPSAEIRFSKNSKGQIFIDTIYL